MPWTFPNSHAILTCSRPAMWSHDARVGEIRDPNLLKLETGLFEANDETGHGQTPQAMKRQDLDSLTMEAGDKEAIVGRDIAEQGPRLAVIGCRY